MNIYYITPIWFGNSEKNFNEISGRLQEEIKKEFNNSLTEMTLKKILRTEDGFFDKLPCATHGCKERRRWLAVENFT